jgi:hypothetical protein
MNMRAARRWSPASAITMGVCLIAVAVTSGGAAASGPPTATASSLEGSSCSHPYRYVRDLRRWYHPPGLGATTTDQEGPGAPIHFRNIRGDISLGYDAFNEEGLIASPSHPLPITAAEFDVQWWLAKVGEGKFCKAVITFHGLPTFIAHTRGRYGAKQFTFHHFHTDRPLKIEVTSAK